MALPALTSTMTSTSQYTIFPMRSFSASMRRETDSRKFIFPPQSADMAGGPACDCPLLPPGLAKSGGGADGSRGTGRIMQVGLFGAGRLRMDFLRGRE